MLLYYGYIRVSTKTQNLNSQFDLLKRYEKENNLTLKAIYHEKESGKSMKDREQFQKLLKVIQPGDTIIFADLSRVSRSTIDLVKLVQDLTNRKIDLISITQTWLNTKDDSPSGKLLLTLFMGLVEFERDIIISRTKQGLESARSRGIIGGRKPIDRNRIKMALMLYDTKTISIAEIAKETKMSTTTISRAVRKRKEEENSQE